MYKMYKNIDAEHIMYEHIYVYIIDLFQCCVIFKIYLSSYIITLQF